MTLRSPCPRSLLWSPPRPWDTRFLAEDAMPLRRQSGVSLSVLSLTVSAVSVIVIVRVIVIDSGDSLELSSDDNSKEETWALRLSGSRP